MGGEQEPNTVPEIAARLSMPLVASFTQEQLRAQLRRDQWVIEDEAYGPAGDVAYAWIITATYWPDRTRWRFYTEPEAGQGTYIFRRVDRLVRDGDGRPQEC